MKKRDIDEFTDEDLAYARSIDFSNGLTVDEMPFIKAYQEIKRHLQTATTTQKSGEFAY